MKKRCLARFCLGALLSISFLHTAFAEPQFGDEKIKGHLYAVARAFDSLGETEAIATAKWSAPLTLEPFLRFLD
jgi:hypothetical protein